VCVEGSDNKSGKPLRRATQALYSMTWRVHVEPRWGALKLRQVDAEAIARWKQEKLDAGAAPKTVINALQLLGSVFRHARRFKWVATNPLSLLEQPIPRKLPKTSPVMPISVTMRGILSNECKGLPRPEVTPRCQD
jgi:hypothetical protein